MSAWVLPDHIADVLPSEARHIEELRRLYLDTARGYGYELVMPPLLEYLESLLSGTGRALDLQTFKLVDQLSGRTLGLRADTTPQVARIDAHLLNRAGVTRLCYCGPVLHTRPDRPFATREPLQFGAEIYGHAGIEADLEVLHLALDSLKAVKLKNYTLDLSDARIVPALLAGVNLSVQDRDALHSALAAKDTSGVQALTKDLPANVRSALVALAGMYGDASVLDQAEKAFAAWPVVMQALAELRQIAADMQDVAITFDLADLRGYAYYSGVRFAIFVPGASDALVRGGRYDEVGAVFGRKRPAVGFSLDLKELVSVVPPCALKAAIRAPWGTANGLREAIAALRANGETVVCVLPGHESEVDEFNCDRELIEVADHWVVQAL
ncbi:MAG: ATP phosphoribosyltransferase regulatory subunit [Burkholderiales bacterium 35-55-47]|jgi:ATP phosphoribosyltransferase regulatory subunit|uniref:ATP phosphoribosyltransferase regulatory subunit n=1 Tax=Limnohabitans sp. TaxID=1907725 RepID=UPI000BCBA95C|nr:ATP phosphoribosyltransferase regulatory subunit [Limnohabitans sp.]OYY19638.1 MAG: ATP phosphoribosyltransferase regulatory subunit [Burkholderiales bacterium 35-55-47]OYZ74752.1 MAG: ATP phosphoribosyltransferase regulatory subunit [Burkholderiales bacterium 24-55-52]OZB01360.1 MAG: ATP phosphoribosyltransferase regulatory subunit [Burkholderiales bacterium 39-55-53]HQR85825.1 ATP phosphoribosyltransferase regulatory subunit [Limnohabitans sp.]HQS26259.1 ATP phosphoribosyltransferase regu